MTLFNLQKELEKWINEGYGEKTIYIDGMPEHLEIDSIQKNTNPGIEPDYLFIMGGEKAVFDANKIGSFSNEEC